MSIVKWTCMGIGEDVVDEVGFVGGTRFLVVV